MTHEIIDIRQFEAQAFVPLLDAESRTWSDELRWDFGPSARIVSTCLREKRLAGYALVSEAQVRGYCFFFYDGDKGLIGDLFLDSSVTGIDNAHRLLNHVIETLLATPGVRRVEAQLPHFSYQALEPCFRSHGFQGYLRRFMVYPLGNSRSPSGVPSLSVAGKASADSNSFVVLPWDRHYDRQAAELLHYTYRNHVDAGINDQYSSLAGTTRLIENIVLQPGCGEYLSGISRIAIHRPSQKLAGLLAVTAVRPRTAHIPQVAVPPPFQGCGLGTLMMESAFQDLAGQGYQEISLTVTDANAGAVRLYERLGFATFREFGAFVYERA
jgi:ribosomal protein S18 acetylase RimI-like enzyme